VLAACSAWLASCDAPAPKRSPDAPPAGWSHWGADAAGTRYSPLDEITPENVARLERAWTFRTGDWDPSRVRATSFQATPVLHEDALYFCSAFNRVFALDAESGALRWVFDPELARGDHGLVCRGVTLWRDPRAEPGAACAVRVFTATQDARLFALDAASGTPCADFGAGGAVDLARGLGEVLPGDVRVTSPPTVIGDVVASGTLISDNRRIDIPGGVIRGWDARTGALRWAFDPAPPASPPLPAGEDGEPRYARGTPNAWSVFAADPERDLLFVPTGNPSNDFYRGGRGAIDHYGSSLIALRGATGERAWHFQTVHHDLWDYDVASQPTLLELEHGGTRVPAVVQPTKVGHVFVLERETGTPLFPVEERPVPQSDLPDEQTAATQPFPTFPPPLHPHGLRAADLFGFTPFDRGDCAAQLAALRNEGAFTPPSLRGSLQYPSVAGGANWGSAAWDPERALLVLTQTRLAMVEQLVPREQMPAFEVDRRGRWSAPMAGTPYALVQGVFLSRFGVPCTRPPWSELLAIDFARREIAWRVPLGTTRGQAPWPFWLRWGAPGMGGPIATRGGLVFIGAAMDGYLRAFDAASGAELWRDHLPAGGQATPMTYRTRRGGRQLVVIAAGGHTEIPGERGDYVIAYALPD
jgi:quinoprotein glucose dehydrogenase